MNPDPNPISKVYASNLTEAVSKDQNSILEKAPQTVEDKAFLDRMMTDSKQDSTLDDPTKQFLNRHNHNNLTDEELLHNLELFHRFFCDPHLDNRINMLYDSNGTLEETFQNLQRQFGKLHIGCVNRGFCDPDTLTGKELNRKLTLIAFCIKTSFDKLILGKMLEHAKDPDMQVMLQELTPEAMFQELNFKDLKKHQQLIYFYLRKASRAQYRKMGDKLYKPKYNSQNQFVHCYEYVCTISEFVFELLYPLDQNHYWFQCLTEKPGVPKCVIDHLTLLHTEWLPKLQPNDNIASFQNGVFYLVNRQFYKFESIQDLMLLEDNVIAHEYHDFPLNL
jgi:hypothetical protein